jgi:hypothetical protein
MDVARLQMRVLRPSLAQERMETEEISSWWIVHAFVLKAADFPEETFHFSGFG